MSKSLVLVLVGGWVVDETKIMQCHLLTEVGVEVEDELGNKNFCISDNESFQYKVIVI